MSPAPVPKEQRLTVPWGEIGQATATYKLSPQSVNDIVGFVTALPEFINLAGRWWKDFLKKEFDVEIDNPAESLRALLTRLSLSNEMMFEVTGSCAEFDAADIGLHDHSPVGPMSNPVFSVQCTPVTGPISTQPCPCDPALNPGGQKTGRKKQRIFTVSWKIKVDFKGVELHVFEQIDKIYVSSPCCCPEEWPPVEEPRREERRNDQR